MEIVVSSWKVRINDEKQKTIAGTYQVVNGNQVIAESTFNEGYNNTVINIPAELMVEAEKLDEKVRLTITKNFGL